MKIDITGASGFVGTNLISYLHNYKITTVNLRNENNIIFESDIEAVIHLAGKAHDLKNVEDTTSYYEINYDLTRKVFDSFINSNAKIFIFMSSVKAVADNLNETLTEEYVANPVTHYGKSKKLAEEYILSKELPKGKKVFILRPCMIHGPGNKGNLNLLYKLVTKGLPWPLGAFQNKRSFCNIENLCFIVSQILEKKEIQSGIYNISDDDTLSTNEIIQLIANSTNKKAKIFTVSKKLILIIAKIGDYLHLPLNNERLNKLTENFVVSNEKIKNALQIKSLPISTKEGMITTIKHFK